MHIYMYITESFTVSGGYETHIYNKLLHTESVSVVTACFQYNLLHRIEPVAIAHLAKNRIEPVAIAHLAKNHQIGSWLTTLWMVSRMASHLDLPRYLNPMATTHQGMHELFAENLVLPKNWWMKKSKRVTC